MRRLPHIALFLFLLLQTSAIFSQNRVDYIYTNFNGYWNTGLNTPLNNTNELLGFRWGSTAANRRVYSTGVDNTILTNNSITFVNTKFKSLPIVDVKFPSNAAGVPTASSFYFGFGSNLDGNTAVAGTPPFTFPDYKISAALNRGVKGMDLGSALANVPASTPLEFDIIVPINSTKLNDGIPDLMFTQQAQPSVNTNEFDEVYFVDAAGATVGTSVLISYNSTTNNVTNFPVVAKWDIDFYEIKPGTPAAITNTQRDIRIFAADLTSFGITTANVGSIKKLRYKFNGSSDPGILAYNEETFTFLKAVNDVATATMSSTVTVNVLANDVYVQNAPVPTVSIFTPPPFGTATVVNNQIQYTAPAGNVPNTVTIVYRICDSSGTNCDNATVTVTIPGGYCNQDFNAAVATSFTETGISSQTRQEAWPGNVPNGFLAMESTSKGFVITRVASQAAITDPKPGMLIYDIQANCVKLYTTSWNCIQRTCID